MATMVLPRSIRLLQPLNLRFNELNPGDRIQGRFERFHKENPHVYAKLVELARSVKEKGHRRFSINALFERLRWYFDFEMETRGSDGFKLNNNFRSRYVRLIRAQEPDLTDFFYVRPLACSPAHR